MLLLVAAAIAIAALALASFKHLAFFAVFLNAKRLMAQDRVVNLLYRNKIIKKIIKLNKNLKKDFIPLNTRNLGQQR